MYITKPSTRAIRFAVSIFLYLYCGMAIAQHNWTRTNPGGGGTIAMAGATANGTMLVASDLSGVYRSTDNGGHWDVLGANNGLTVSHTTALGFHTTDGNTFFVGTGEGLYKTSNGGNSLSRVLPNASNPFAVEYIESIVVAQSNPNVVYVAQHEWDSSGAANVYKSIDGGDSWQATVGSGLPSNQNIIKLVVHPSDANLVYLLTGKSRFWCSPARLYKSTDGGSNWSQLGAVYGDVLDMDIHPTDTSVVFMSTFQSNGCPANLTEDYQYIGGDENSGALYKSSNGGSSFTQLTDKTGIISAGITHPDTIRIVDILFPYDWNDNAGTWESTNAGLTWSHTGLVSNWNTGFTNNQYFAYVPSFNGLSKTLTKDIFNADNMYGAFGQWAWATFDGGKHLNNISTKSVGSGWLSTGMENITGHVLDVSDSNPNVIYMGGYDIGFWVSTDHGGSWNRTQPDYNTYSNYVWDIGVVPVDPALAVTGEGSNISAILNDPAREEVVWATFSREQYSDESTGSLARTGLFKSIAHGAGWQQMTAGLPTGDNSIRMYGLSIDVASPTNSRTLYMTVKGDVYKSVDDGLSWVMVLANGRLKFTAVDKFNSNLIYAGGSGGLWRSIDAGASWVETGSVEMRATATHTPMREDIVPTSPEIDWSTGQAVTTLYPWEGVFDIQVDPNIADRVYITVHGPGKGLYRSDNAGQSWTKLISDDHMRGVAVAPQDSTLVYATSSKSYYSGASGNSQGILYSQDSGATWNTANDGMAWNYGGAIEVETGGNPNVWAWSPGTGIQYSPAALSTGVPSAVTLISPVGVISDSTPEYRWQASSGATWYYLWVDDNSGNRIKKWYTASSVDCGGGSGICSITPPTSLLNGSGQWWVQPWNSAGYGQWSAAMSFNLIGSPAAATLISPSGAINDTTPTYRWNAVAGSSWYYLWVDDSNGNAIKKWYKAADAECGNGESVCSVTPVTPLANGAGRWWVKTWNSTGYGPWSAGLAFTVN